MLQKPRVLRERLGGDRSVLEADLLACLLVKDFRSFFRRDRLFRLSNGQLPNCGVFVDSAGIRGVLGGNSLLRR